MGVTPEGLKKSLKLPVKLFQRVHIRFFLTTTSTETSLIHIVTICLSDHFTVCHFHWPLSLVSCAEVKEESQIQHLSLALSSFCTSRVYSQVQQCECLEALRRREPLSLYFNDITTTRFSSLPYCTHPANSTTHIVTTHNEPAPRFGGKRKELLIISWTMFLLSHHASLKCTGNENTDTDAHTEWLPVFVGGVQMMLPSPPLIIASIVGIVWEGDTDSPRPV